MGSGRGIGSPSRRLTASAVHATDGELASECWKHARCQSRTHPLVLFSTSCHVDAIMSVGGGCESLDARARILKKSLGDKKRRRGKSLISHWHTPAWTLESWPGEVKPGGCSRRDGRSGT